MFAARALVLAAALLQPDLEEVPTASTDPYRCSVEVHMDGLSGGMWRDFRPGQPDDYYQIQINNPDAVDSGPFAAWSVDNRPPARPRVYGWSVGRPEADAFRNGPESVAFGIVRYGQVVDGAIFARLYGDGAFAGTILAQRPNMTRRVHRLGGDGLSLFLSQRGYPQIFASIGSATSWEAVLVDASGRELGRKTVRVPSPAAAAAEFDRARIELLGYREDFLRRPTWNRDKPCSTFIDELDAPI